MTGPVIQNFSVPADDDVELTVTVDDSLGLSSLQDFTIQWRVYAQEWGSPDPEQSALISKSTDSGIAIPGSPPLVFTIQLSAADTAGLLGNYYHEATLVDVQSDRTTVMQGLVTVTPTENR